MSIGQVICVYLHVNACQKKKMEAISQKQVFGISLYKEHETIHVQKKQANKMSKDEHIILHAITTIIGKSFWV